MFCEKCFEDIHSEVVDISDEITENPIQIPKSRFIKTKVTHIPYKRDRDCAINRIKLGHFLLLCR